MHLDKIETELDKDLQRQYDEAKEKVKKRERGLNKSYAEL